RERCSARRARRPARSARAEDAKPSSPVRRPGRPRAPPRRAPARASAGGATNGPWGATTTKREAREGRKGARALNRSFEGRRLGLTRGLARHEIDLGRAELAQQLHGPVGIELGVPRFDREEEAVVGRPLER